MATVFADKLCLRAFFRILAMRLAGPVGVVLLDATGDSRVQRLAIVVLALCGVEVRISTVRRPHIDTETGRDLQTEANALADAEALQAAAALVRESAALRKVDETFRTGTLALIIAKHFLWDLRTLELLTLAADHLARSAPAGSCSAFLHFAPEMTPRLPAGSLREVVLLRPRFQGLRVLLRVLRRLLADVIRELRLRKGLGFAIQGLRPGVPSIVVMPDGNISLDRSFRSCPLWHFPQTPCSGKYQVIVLHSQINHTLDSLSLLAENGVLLLRESDLGHFAPASKSLEAKVRRAKWALLWAMVCGHPAPWELDHVIQHLLGGLLFARMAKACGVRAMLTPKCYETLPDAVDLVADAAGLTTFHYQYSFLNYRTALAARRSDYLILFSDFFRRYYDFGTSQKVVANGYIFGSSLPLISLRSQQIRQALHAAGVRFVLCFFPENFMPDFESHQNREEYLASFQAVAEFVASRPDMGLVLKAKIPARSPVRMVSLPAVDLLLAQGRLIDVGGQSQYSTAFPYEAGCAADMVLGEAIGCTAVYECVLGGARGILYGTAGRTSATQRLLEEHGLVYPGLEQALEAVQAAYERRPGFERIGDWSGVAEQFDSHRDYGAGHRLRQMLLSTLGLAEIPDVPGERPHAAALPHLPDSAALTRAARSATQGGSI